jgi:hypothetical protein
MVQENPKRFKLNGTRHLLIHAEDSNLWGEFSNNLTILYYTMLYCTVTYYRSCIHIVGRNNTQKFCVSIKGVGLEVNAEEAKYVCNMFVTYEQNAEENHVKVG